MNENEISRLIYESAIEAHKTLGGAGLLESVYEEALEWEMKQRGLDVKRQVCLPVCYKGNTLGTPLRIDLLVNDKVVVECKAAREHNSIFEVQLLTYLRMGGFKLGMLINFGEQLVKNGIHRVVNGL